MPATIEEGPGGRVVVLAGEVSIASAAELRDVLVAALAVGGLALDLGRVEALDVTTLQLLVAARRAAADAGRTFAITVQPPAAIAAWCALAGMAEVLA